MTGRVAAVLVVPQGTHRPEPLAEALLAHHPAWEVEAVWCGDPYLRPRLNGLSWLDDGRLTAAQEIAIVAGDALVGEWRRALGAVGGLIASGAECVVVLWVGSTAVLSGIETLVATEGQPMTLVVRAVEPLPDDGLAPTEGDLIDDGLYSTTVAAFGSGSVPVVEWLEAQLRGTAGVGRLLPRAAQLFGVTECRDESIGVGRWRWSSTEPALLDVGGYDTRSPWTLDPAAPHPMRVELLGSPARQAALARAAPQLAGERTALCLPGGLHVDDTIRQVVARSSSPVPAPWGAAAEFRDWLAPRYWQALHHERPDLLSAFPDPNGRSAVDFRRWCRGAFTVDDVGLLLTTPAHVRDPVVAAETFRTDGLNLVGYFTRASGLGDVARRLLEAVEQVKLPHTTVATQRTSSPVAVALDVDNRVEFTNSVCVVTADQFPFLAEDFPDLFAATTRMIGYWFWELDYIPLHMRQSFTLVDEIWAGSRFVTDAFAAVSPVPVRLVPIPVAEPRRSDKSRGDFPLLADVGERIVFMTILDHLSVTERKNPIGVIEAFRKAFAPDEGPVLIVKTMNGHQRWPQHHRVLAAADGRDDIRVWDETLERADQMALVADVDCVVSLHRSEGLGLHLAEAMWLGTPTIATRYSGNLDFMNDNNSLLIDAELVNVEHGERVYPPTAKWAEPDLEEAAEAMRRIADDSALRAGIANVGRRTMERQPSLVETGKLISRLLRGEG